MTAAVQTIWAELIASSLADAGVSLCVISPGSRSTPLVAALAQVGSLRDVALVTIIDERAAAFYALGAARATGRPVALVCTSGTAAAHYLPAIVEASMARVPLIALTANRPPELHDCGASQTIDQRALYGGFVRGSFDLGAPVASELALRAVRRKIVQAITLSLGPDPGPVHIDVPLRKPLEPALPTSDGERALARFAADLSTRRPDTTDTRRAESCAHPNALVAPPRSTADPSAITALARTIAREPRGVIVVGAMPASFGVARDLAFALASRAGYPIVAEAASQLRFGPCPPGVVLVDHFDLIPVDRMPEPMAIIQLGSEPVAAAWPGFLALARRASRWVLSGSSWRDPDSSADCVIVGEIEGALAAIVAELPSDDENASSGFRTPLDREPVVLDRIRLARRNVERAAASMAWLDDWRRAGERAATAVASALAAHPRSEACVVRAAIDAMPRDAIVQIANSLPIRVVDHVCTGGPSRSVISQRGAAGIDGLIASAAGATHAGHPVLLVLGDVAFAHDLSALLAARTACAPLAILVIDNRGGQIFAGLPIARTELGAAFERHWLTTPDIDPAAIASALGATAVTAASAAAVASAVGTALAAPGVTVIHAPVTPTGAHDLRRTALQLHAGADDVRTALQLHAEVSAPALAKLGGES